MKFKVSGARLLIGSQLLSAALSFFRNIVIVRMVTVEEYGVVAAFSLVLTFVEVISQLSFDKYLLVTDKSSVVSHLSVIHSLSIFRGIVLSLPLIIFCEEISLYFEVEEYWLFGLVALIPFIRGFTSYGYVLKQRDMDFMPISMFELVPQLTATLLAYPLILLLDNLLACAILIVSVPLVAVLTSHFLVNVKYQISWDSDSILKIWSFSWPLLTSGILVFASMQGDKAVVAYSYDTYHLGMFSAIFALFSMPTLILQRILTSYYTPLASNSPSVERIFDEIIAVSSFFSILALSGMAFIGAYLVPLILGAEYANNDYLVLAFACVFSLRVFGISHRLLPLVTGNTSVILGSTVIRCVVLPLALYFGAIGERIELIVIVSFLGELIALVYLVYRNGRTGYDIRSTIVDLVIFLFFVASVFYMFYYHFENNLILSILYFGLIFSCYAVIAFFIRRDFLLRAFSRLVSK